ncbi:SgcJ/EcaC family oxidoreductase [Candidatus Latescibacterota bacterium]
MKRLPIFFLVISILVISTCTKSSDTESDIEAIENIQNLFERAFNENNINMLMALYTDDAIVMPPNAPTIYGKEAIRNFYQYIEEEIFDITYPADEVQVFGDLAFRRGTLKGTWKAKEGEESGVSNNKGLVLLRRQSDGSWKISHAIFNSNQPQSFTDVMPTLSVTGVEKSIEYYTTVLGFTKIMDWPADEENKTFGVIRKGEATVHLAEDEQGPRGIMVYYALKDVDDVDKLHEQYKAAGAKIKQPPTDEVWGAREMRVEDIDGHVMRIGANIPQIDNEVTE